MLARRPQRWIGALVFRKFSQTYEDILKGCQGLLAELEGNV